jgi:site-specific recombinase XerD
MAYIPTIAFVFDRRKTASAKQEGSVELRITHERKQKFMSTGIRIFPKEWKGGRVVSRIDASELNATLDELLLKVRRIINDMMENDNLNINIIPSMLVNKTSSTNKKTSFIAFCRERAEVRKYGKTKDSQERYNRFMRFFEQWGGITTFAGITDAAIIEMDKVLAEKKLIDSSKWNNYHRFLNSFIMDAVDEGLIRRNPYKHIRINRDKESRSLWKHLTAEEFDMVRTAKLPTTCLEQVRDVFVFQVYTCMSYVDLAAFDFSLVKTNNQDLVYSGTRGKTGQEYSFMLMRPAREILDKYNGKLPIISNVKYNAYLKALAQHAGIDKPLTSHWARHTGATLLLNSGVDMEVVAKVLGHSSTKITREVYAKLLDSTVYDAMRKAEKKIKLD